MSSSKLLKAVWPHNGHAASLGVKNKKLYLTIFARKFLPILLSSWSFTFRKTLKFRPNVIIRLRTKKVHRDCRRCQISSKTNFSYFASNEPHLDQMDFENTSDSTELLTVNHYCKKSSVNYTHNLWDLKVDEISREVLQSAN